MKLFMHLLLVLLMVCTIIASIGAYIIDDVWLSAFTILAWFAIVSVIRSVRLGG